MSMWEPRKLPAELRTWNPIKMLLRNAGSYWFDDAYLAYCNGWDSGAGAHPLPMQGHFKDDPWFKRGHGDGSKARQSKTQDWLVWYAANGRYEREAEEIIKAERILGRKLTSHEIMRARAEMCEGDGPRDIYDEIGMM